VQRLESASILFLFADCRFTLAELAALSLVTCQTSDLDQRENMSRFAAWMTVAFIVSPSAVWAQAQPPARAANTSNLFDWYSRISYLGQASVQQELKLTAEQLQEFDRIRNTVRPGSARGDDNNRSDARAALEKSVSEGNKQLDALLTSEQKARLRQIDWQRRRVAGLASLIDVREIRAELKLTEEQSSQLGSLERKLFEERRKLDRSDRDAYAAKNRELVASSDQDVEKLLTPEQNAKLKELLGPPFTGELRWGPGVAGFGSRDASDRSPRSFEVGSVARSPWSYLRYPDVQKDLKLTDEQREKLPNLGQLVGVRAEEAQKVLTADQAARLWQVQLHIRQKRSGPAYIFRYRDVAEALKLSDEQKKALAALASGGFGGGTGRTVDQVQQQIAEILVDDQEAKLKNLLGPAFEGEVPQGGFSTASTTDRSSRVRPEFEVGSTAQAPPGGWLRYPAVREELKLTDEQAQKVNALLERVRTVPSGSLAELLTPEQLARLREVQLQLVARRLGSAYLFRYREVAEPLALSEEQKEKIKQLARANNQFRISAETVAQIRSQLNEILTADQRAALEKLLGKPFEGELGSGNPLSPRSGGGRQRPSG
jgi:Spy/CpxP family protein refolding chaperone